MSHFPWFLVGRSLLLFALFAAVGGCDDTPQQASDTSSLDAIETSDTAADSASDTTSTDGASDTADTNPADVTNPLDTTQQDLPNDVTVGPKMWCATQWPASTITTAGTQTEPLYVRVWVEGVTPSAGSDSALEVEVGLGPAGTTPSSPSWVWGSTSHNAVCGDCGNNDEWMGTLTPASPGALLWAGRVRYADGDWLFCDRYDEGRQGSDDGWAEADAPALTALDGQAPTQLVTINLRCLLDNWDARLPILADGIAAIDPVAIGFQEVCSEPGGRDNLDELLAALASRTGRTYEVRRANTHWSWDLYDEGIAVVSAVPIADAAIVDLPAGVFPRKMVMIRTNVGGGRVFATTHLDQQDASVRAQQIDALVAYLTGFAADIPTILTGDFNESPGGAVQSTLNNSGFIDVWGTLRPAELGGTSPDTVRNRIDYVWLDGKGTLNAQQISLLFEQPVNGVSASDHLGLWATVGQ